MDENFYSEFFGHVNISPTKFNNKNLVNYHTKQMLMRTQMMFEYDNLPETIPTRTIELNVQCRGYVGFIKYEDKYYATYGGIGAGLNHNYLPKKFIATNPYIGKSGLSKEFDIYYGEEEIKSNMLDNYCVVIPNDTFYMGILPLCNYYSTLDTINDISLKMVLINSRAQNVFIAPDNSTVLSIKDFMKDLEDGENSQILSKSFLKSLETLPFAGTTNSTAVIRELIEHKQYNKACWYNDLGLQANYNMKRESLNSNENQLNEDSIIPLPDLMLYCRKEAIKNINKLFGLNISVDFSSVWKDKRIENKLAIKQQESAVKSNKLDKGDEENVEEQSDNGNTEREE